MGRGGGGSYGVFWISIYFGENNSARDYLLNTDVIGADDMGNHYIDDLPSYQAFGFIERSSRLVILCGKITRHHFRALQS